MYLDSHAALAIALAIVSQTGVLIWKLSSMDSKLNNICIIATRADEASRRNAYVLSGLLSRCDTLHPGSGSQRKIIDEFNGCDKRKK